ncbi:class D beta-lactamase [Paenibacillus sp. 1_12]|uniref:class D beta-lactamase n=1 Tax=Paenibacillus sp. 1_12 TaxID=1566278 RepID=UPI00210B39DE|nr:class D beta-lactamase [Paenibacillus sp. 1_12]
MVDTKLIQGEADRESKPQIEHLDISIMNVDKYFPNNEGTFVLRNLRSDQTFIFNKERALKRQPPESTFKIVNALIGLQVGAVKDEYDVKRWDGVKRTREEWNKDHTLGSAMRTSALWYYQAITRDIGKERMQEWLNKLNYGNKDISAGIDTFWLNSSLQISPLEEVDFLSCLVQEKLPLDKNMMKTVKRMLIQDEGEHYTLYGKTGTRNNPLAGWYVGFVESKQQAYVFAANMDGQGTISPQKIKDLATDILLEYRIIEPK